MRDEFKVHLLNDRGLKLAADLAESFSDLVAYCEEVCGPPSRERSLGITKLQEACFWFKRAIANEAVNQVQPGDGERVS